MTIPICRFCGKKNPTQYHVNSCKLKETEKKLAEALKNSPPPAAQEPQKPPQTKEPVRVKKRVVAIEEDNKVICDSCESEIEGKPKFCPNCGVELEW